MSSIGILGVGRVGANLATKLSEAGHQVTLGARNACSRCELHQDVTWA